VLAALTLLIAAAGGGSSGFGGGGGGGGGFSGGGGSYGGGGSSCTSDTCDAIGIGVVLLIVFGAIAVVISLVVASMKLKARRRRRAEQIKLASAEAAEDDAYLSTEAVTTDAGALFVACQQAWDARDETKLATLVGDDLMVEWRRRLADFANKGWHNRVKVERAPRIEYVGLVNRADDDEDRVTVRVIADLKDYVQTETGKVIFHTGKNSMAAHLDEYWTLIRCDGRWKLESIQQEAEGRHHLDDQIVAVPEADEQSLKDESLIELAQADAAPAGTNIAELVDVDFADDARAAALDLSLADARFGTDVLEIAVRRAVGAWAQAIDGDDTALAGVASPDAINELLYGADGSASTRVVVRGPKITQMRITKLNADANPPKMAVEIDVHGTRYVEDRDTLAVVDGSKSGQASWTERWTLELGDDQAQPWRLASAAAPAAR
jgi:predicted lipid-binding transport protein (Tim44 family)